MVIDNKDYNYTLIISGQDIQVIHHDTNKNLTYRHGLDVSLTCRKLLFTVNHSRRARYHKSELPES